jgi:hypothetical protein
MIKVRVFVLKLTFLLIFQPTKTATKSCSSAMTVNRECFVSKLVQYSKNDITLKENIRKIYIKILLLLLLFYSHSHGVERL